MPRGKRRALPVLEYLQGEDRVVFTSAEFTLPCVYAAEAAADDDLLSALCMWVDCLTATSGTAQRMFVGFPWVRIEWTAVLSKQTGRVMTEVDRTPFEVRALRVDRNPSTVGRPGMPGDVSPLRFGFPRGPEGYRFKGNIDGLRHVTLAAAEDGTHRVAPALSIPRFAPALDLGFALSVAGYPEVADRMWSQWKRIVRDGGAHRAAPRHIDLGPARSREDYALYESRF